MILEIQVFASAYLLFTAAVYTIEADLVWPYSRTSVGRATFPRSEEYTNVLRRVCKCVHKQAGRWWCVHIHVYVYIYIQSFQRLAHNYSSYSIIVLHKEFYRVMDFRIKICGGVAWCVCECVHVCVSECMCVRASALCDPVHGPRRNELNTGMDRNGQEWSTRPEKGMGSHTHIRVVLTRKIHT